MARIVTGELNFVQQEFRIGLLETIHFHDGSQRPASTSPWRRFSTKRRKCLRKLAGQILQAEWLAQINMSVLVAIFEAYPLSKIVPLMWNCREHHRWKAWMILDNDMGTLDN